MYLVEMSWLLLLVLNSQVPQHQSYLSHQCSRNKDEECIFIPVLFLLKNVFCNPSVTFKHITVAPSPPRINYMIVSPMMPITWFRRSLVPTEKSLILSLVFIFINVLYVICRENKIVYVLHTMMYFQASEYKGRRIQGKKFP